MRGRRLLVTILVVLAALFAIFLVVWAAPPFRLGERFAQPSFCAGCHNMKPEYVAFQANRAHARLDACNECHLPNTDPVTHFIADGIVGTRDLVEFYVLGRAPYDTQATDWTKSVVEANCIRCHAKTVAHVDVSGRKCWDCHRVMYHRVQLEVIDKTPLGEDAPR